MEEQVVKKRGWVKNAVIAFLSIMLVLTFFSNTIMNRSLPEVATAFVESGTINAKIRGSGTVSAGESYDVVMDQTRKVSSVLVKVGDLVETGDVLFTLSETESDELKQAQDTLEDMRLNYQKSVLNMDSADYAQENRNIQKAREALTEAKAEMENCAVSDDQIYQAQMALKEVQRAKKGLEDALKKLQDDRSESASRYDTLEGQITDWEKDCETLSDAIAGYEKQIRSLKAGTGNLAGDLESAKTALIAAKENVAALRITYGKDYDDLKKAAEYKDKFFSSLFNDLRCPEALAVMWKMVKDGSVSDADKLALLLKMDKVLSLSLDKVPAKKEEKVGGEEEWKLVEERSMAKKNKDYARADQIRKELEERGYLVKDTPKGPILEKIL